MTFSRRRFLHLTTAAAVFAPRVVSAQAYPARAVRVIVPYAPAGPTDVFARLMAQKLSEQLGAQFYVENIARAGDVLDVELRTQLLRELLRHEAGEHVGRTGGRVRNDDAHRSRGIGLCADDARSEHGGSGGEMQKSATGKGHPGPLLHCAAVAARSPSLYSIRRFSS